MQPPQSYNIGRQCSSGQLTGKPAGARPEYRGRCDNRSDEDFEVCSEDFNTSDSDADLSFSDDDEEDVEPRTAGDWVFITDPYHDASPPSFDFAPVYTDVHPAVELESLCSPLECFLAFVPKKRITYLCDCTNKRAYSYFTELVRREEVDTSDDWFHLQRQAKEPERPVAKRRKPEHPQPKRGPQGLELVPFLWGEGSLCHQLPPPRRGGGTTGGQLGGLPQRFRGLEGAPVLSSRGRSPAVASDRRRAAPLCSDRGRAVSPEIEGDYLLLLPPSLEGDYLLLLPPSLEGDYLLLLPPPLKGDYLQLPPPPLEGDYLLLLPPPLKGDYLQLPPPPPEGDYLLLPQPPEELMLPLEE
ncbi:UNVERIFIED_CONTAM: hypothetical protein FKN15_037970 [Acipenser sinensis]